MARLSTKRAKWIVIDVLEPSSNGLEKNEY